TLGAAGFLWRENGAEHHVEAVKVAAIDTLAAGDVWHAAFVIALAEGRATGDAARFANVAAALKCMRAGGRRGAPTRTEVLAKILEIAS
ncbi:MAG TPA: PfkB family carbohydrate kinase, partial [Casimicrobiaceae bacterium]